MKKTAAQPATIDAYIADFPVPIRKGLEQMRTTISKAAPAAAETLSYGIPTFTLHGNLVHFAAYKHHIGFYPAPSGITAFQKELSVYKGAKGSVQFPLDQPLPLALVKQIVQFRVKENEEKAKQKSMKTKKPLTAKKQTSKPSDAEQVQAYMNQLPAAQKTDLNALRTIIKSASSKLNERIKWNAPSYYYQAASTAETDIVTFGPYKTHKLLLVFHHPLIVKIKSTLLEGNAKDRRLIHFKDKADVKAKKEELVRIISELIKLIEKK